MVEVLEGDQWWDGHIEAQEQREGVWWAKVRYRRDDGQHGAWFPRTGYALRHRLVPRPRRGRHTFG
ncbi:hypothetical protein [Nocardioides lijunqiniae]|uniref:hypothetical protein n=1 Tax=Nocardioides lijunqiniae TaxID=2760832 RepID=UPI001877AAFB|nr:hypothetical protein [Nocardioides lijunqiniae]